MAKPEVQTLPVKLLTIDPRVQRSLDRKKAARMAAEFNADAIGVIAVSHRDGGEYVVIDGQHRAEAMRIAGHSEDSIRAEVYEGLSLAEEALIFRLRNNTTVPLYVDRFRIRVIEGEPQAIAVLAILESHGWQLATSTSDGHFAAIRSLENVYTAGLKSSPNPADLTMATITGAWGRIAAAGDGRIVEGIGAVHNRYGTAVELSALIERLAKLSGGPANLIGRARGLKDLTGSTVSKAVAEIVVDTYNRQRRTKALPPWRAS